MIEQMFASENPSIPLFRLAFRVFFLFGALFSALAMAIWLLVLNGHINLSLHGGPVVWHIHEMIFGFVAAIIVGFLLTAVQTWTGVKSVNGMPLFCLFICWLFARLGFLFSEVLNPFLLAGVDISFLLMSALFLSIPIIKVRQARNLFFVPVLLLLSLCNGLMHVGIISDNQSLVMHGVESTLMLVSVLMVVIGGRVIPMFTANGSQTQRVPNIAWLDKVALAMVWIIAVLFLMGLNDLLPKVLLGSLFILAGGLHAFRVLRWRFWITWRVPLLWPLHLSYGLISLAFILSGYEMLIGLEPSSISWHILTVGGMGILILAMVSRVSLGHTGRKLIAPSWLAPAFIIITASMLLRTFLPSLLPDQTLWWLNLSGMAWIVAYGIFVMGYYTVLTKPRVDQRPG